MGQKLFGVDISGLIHRNMSAGLVPITLKQTTPGTRSATNPTAAPAPKTSTHSARGFQDAYTDSQIDGTLIERGDRRILLIGDSITPAAVPQPGDEITIQGETLTIVANGVSRDPAAATYTCQARAY